MAGPGSSGLYIRAGSRRSSPASLPGFAGYFHCFTSQKYVEEMDPQPSTFLKTPATYKLKENAGSSMQISEAK